jgi:hypothetical protein
MITANHEAYLQRRPKKVEYPRLPQIFPGSSMVEQEAVNFEVVGSSPTPGAKP